MRVSKKQKKSLVKISFIRNSSGMFLYARSSVFGGYFKRIADGPPCSRWGNTETGPRGHRIVSCSDFHVNLDTGANYNVTFKQWNERWILRQGCINLSFLRAHGIEKGIKIPVNRPMTEETMKHIVEVAKKGCLKFYKQYISDAAVELEVTVKEIV